MPTFTSRLSLQLDDDLENYSIDVVNANLMALDTNIGLVVCTSVTRPSTPYNGQMIYETDTGLFGLWRTDLGQWVLPRATPYAAAARPTLGLYSGYILYRTDRNWLEVWDGAAWRVMGVAVCTSAADVLAAITNPYSGQMAITTDTDSAWQYDGATSTWFPLYGIVGGRDITGGNNLGTTVGSTELNPTSMNTGAITLQATTRYQITARYKVVGGVVNDLFLFRLRVGAASGIAGTQILDKAYLVEDPGTGLTEPIEIEWENTGGSVVRVFSFTAQRLAGTGTITFSGGAAGTTSLVGIRVKRLGPSGLVTVTAS